MKKITYFELLEKLKFCKFTVLLKKWATEVKKYYFNFYKCIRIRRNAYKKITYD